MFGVSRAGVRACVRPRAWQAALAIAALSLAACSSNGGFSVNDLFTTNNPPSAPPPPQQMALGSGQVKVGLVLPMSASGNAGAVGQSMRSAAEMALTEFNNPDLQLLLKDDAGTQQGAQLATQQALDEGSELILGPLFAQSVQVAGQVARARNVPVIAFSTDSNVASRGVYLLSFLPETDVDRIVDFAVSQGKRSFLAIVPDNAYGGVVEAEFRQYVARKGGRVLALAKYGNDQNQMRAAVQTIAQAQNGADALFIPGEGDAVPALAQMLTSSGVNMRRLQILGTGLWEDSRVFAEPTLQGGFYPAPDPNGPNSFRAFAVRYRQRFGQEPVRTATLSYDAVALAAALIKTQGQRRFSNEVLTNTSGFAGIDGVFRFRPDGTNQRGLAVMRVTPQGGQVAAPAPRNFGSSGT